MTAEIEPHIRAIYAEWNAKNLEGVLEAFKALGPNGFTVEYIGNAPIEGVAAVEEMWATYGKTCKTELAHLLVNGSEAAALVHNIITCEGDETVLPSIETYHLENGRLRVRYYHNDPAAGS